MKLHFLFYSMLGVIFFSSCNDYFRDDYTDNSPTSGKLKVYCDEGLKRHILNQAATFKSQYHRAEVEVVCKSDAEAVEALFNDTCRAIVISRELSPNEKKSFASKNLTPRFSIIAYSGVALITNVNTSLTKLSTAEIQQLLLEPYFIKDSLNNQLKITAVFESNKSSVVNYLKDSLIKGKSFSENCSALENSLEVINYIAKTPNAIGFIDFAWLSDRDDSLFKANLTTLKFIPIGNGDGNFYEPNQSSFKTNEYPLTRKVYLYHQAPEFSLAKGFVSFVAGPKGQMTFLKQGLLPFTQQERIIEVKME